MPAVIVDTSVLITLAAAEQFGLLREFYGVVYVPPAVWEEASAGRRMFGCAEAARAREQGWLIVQKPNSLDRVERLPFHLQAGETEALALALELPEMLLLIDDAQGRRAADALGISYTGTLGVLLRAKRESRIPALRPVLDLLRKRTTFWLSAAVSRAALEKAGE
jgi:predicted nucleic acid-binding protein